MGGEKHCSVGRAEIPGCLRVDRAFPRIAGLAEHAAGPGMAPGRRRVHPHLPLLRRAGEAARLAGGGRGIENRLCAGGAGPRFCQAANHARGNQGWTGAHHFAGPRGGGRTAGGTIPGANRRAAGDSAAGDPAGHQPYGPLAPDHRPLRAPAGESA